MCFNLKKRFFFGLIGIGDQCSHRGVKRFTKELSEWSKSEGYCL